MAIHLFKLSRPQANQSQPYPVTLNPKQGTVTTIFNYLGVPARIWTHDLQNS